MKPNPRPFASGIWNAISWKFIELYAVREVVVCDVPYLVCELRKWPASMPNSKRKLFCGVWLYAAGFNTLTMLFERMATPTPPIERMLVVPGVANSPNPYIEYGEKVLMLLVRVWAAAIDGNASETVVMTLNIRLFSCIVI